MPITIGKKGFEKDECVAHEVFFDDKMMRAAPGSATLPKPAGSFVFYLRPLLSGDSKELSNKMMRGDRRGETRYMAGTVAAQKVILSTVAVEGRDATGNPEPIQDPQGREVCEVTAATYGFFPSWVMGDVLEQINKINGENDEREESEKN